MSDPLGLLGFVLWLSTLGQEKKPRQPAPQPTPQQQQQQGPTPWPQPNVGPQPQPSPQPQPQPSPTPQQQQQQTTPVTPTGPGSPALRQAAEKAYAALASDTNYCQSVKVYPSPVNAAVHAFKLQWNAENPGAPVPIGTSNYENSVAQALGTILIDRHVPPGCDVPGTCAPGTVWNAATGVCEAKSWPTPVVPGQLPVFPGPGWKYAKPLTSDISARAWYWNPQLWSYATKTIVKPFVQEQYGGQWMTFKAAWHPGKNGPKTFMGTEAYVLTNPLPGG